ncbi:thioesterase II family protein [Mucilaginibacter sp. UYCu711]|uniref:thioesterase II family protein n=1 Tax=Mucilaginibacter sp. UYCu711 TaxID=3156339 RepID=UPI003D1F958E
MKTINLICLAFAGGNRYSYRLFSEKAPPVLNLITLEYPGRGSRIKEELATDITLLIDDLYVQVNAIANSGPYAIYGHSMGGLLAYLLTLKLAENNREQPQHVFISGTSGPSSKSRSEKMRHLLERAAFIEEIRKLDGMPQEILENEELLAYLEPILRADFKISENYQHTDRLPLNLPFTVITGSEEELETEDVLLWQKETTQQVDFIQLPGKHFFILQHPEKILDIIFEKLIHQSITHLNYD